MLLMMHSYHGNWTDWAINFQEFCYDGYSKTPAVLIRSSGSEQAE